MVRLRGLDGTLQEMWLARYVTRMVIGDWSFPLTTCLEGYKRLHADTCHVIKLHGRSGDGPIHVGKCDRQIARSSGRHGRGSGRSGGHEESDRLGMEIGVRVE